MTLKKVVDGKVVVMSSAEEAMTNAEWRVWDERPGTVEQVKEEAADRIQTVMPLYKQLNAVRHMLDMRSKHGMPSNWPTKDKEKYDEYMRDFAEIDRIREVSNTLETADIPQDVNDDSYWIKPGG